MTTRPKRINLWRTERHRRRLERALDLALGLAILLLVMGLVWLGSIGIRGIRQDRSRLDLELSLRHLHQEITAIQPRVAEAKSEVEALSLDMLPNLIPVRTGRPIAIDDRFVSNITFTWADPGKSLGLQYRLLAHNTVGTAVYLRFDILFFDRKGKEIGISHVGGAGSEKPTILERGELDTISAPIEITAMGFGERDIRYFRLKFAE